MKTTTPISGSRKCQGFTLIELLLVFFLLVLVAGLATSFMAGGDQKTFSTNLRQITTQLTHSRRQAIITGAEQEVVLSTKSVEQTTTDELPEPPAQWQNQDMQLRYSATLDDSLEEASELVVTFFPMGSSTGGLIELSNSERETFIYISALTGKLIIETDIDVIGSQVQGEQP